MSREQTESRVLTAAEARAAIAALRPKIDAADAAALAALTERAALVAEVGRVKAAAGLPVLDASREAAVLDRVEARTGRRAMRAVWRVVMAAARASEAADAHGAAEAENAEKMEKAAAAREAAGAGESVWRIAWRGAAGAPPGFFEDLLAMLLALDIAPLEVSRLADGALRLRFAGGIPAALARELAERGAAVERVG